MISRRSFLAGSVGLAGGALLVSPQPAVAAQGALPAVTWSPANPVLTPTEDWEGTFAAPYSGGIWRVDGVWRCYYLCGSPLRLALAFSDDGIQWRKTGIVCAGKGPLDSTGVWYAPGELAPWKMSAYDRAIEGVVLLESVEGINWFGRYPVGAAGDRTTFWHDGERYHWGVRAGAGTAGDPRRADLVSSPDFIPKAWEPQPWLRADRDDPHDETSGGIAQLYAVDVVPYEGVFVGFATIWRGLRPNRPKLNDVTLMVSRDGKEWIRPWRQPWLTRSNTPGAWNYGNVQSVGHGLHAVGADLYIYASGRSGLPDSSANGVVSMGLGTVKKAAFDAAIHGALNAVSQ